MNEEKNQTIETRTIKLTPRRAVFKMEPLLFSKKDLKQCEPEVLEHGRKFRNRGVVVMWTLVDVMRASGASLMESCPNEMTFMGVHLSLMSSNECRGLGVVLAYAVNLTGNTQTIMTMNDVLFRREDGSFSVWNSQIFMSQFESLEDILLKDYHTNLTKPPLGLRPRFISDVERMQEILEATERYVDAGVPVPEKWSDEYRELMSRNEQWEEEGC